MKTSIVFVLSLAFVSVAARAELVTTGPEQQSYIEQLSGVSQLGIGGLPSLISQRFSDSVEIQTTARYLKAKYDAAGIDAQILEYDPMDSFPYYFRNIDETYRSYFIRLTPVLKSDFDGLCAGTLPADRIEPVLARLARVGLEKNVFCLVPAAERVEKYISTTVQHTTEVTKVMLQNRALATWPNVVALVPTGEGGETGTRPVCIVGAHMDSVARDGGGRGPIVSPGTLAPGADDNASGTAGVMTLARAFHDRIPKDAKLPCDLAFVHFSGEEEGLLGSIAFLHFQMRRPIQWMVNFDMIGYNAGTTNGQPGVMNVGYDKRFGRGMADLFADEAEKLKTIVVERDVFTYSSDQIAFWTMGIPALAISEEACADETCASPYMYFNPKVHTPDDVAALLDFDYAANIINHSYDGILKLITYKRR